MPVLQVTGSMPLEKDQVYVIPPNRGLIMEDGKVDAAEFTEPRGWRAPVDYFFRSLAKEKLQSVDEELHVHAEQQIRSLASELTATEQAELDEKVRVLTFYAVREILSIIVKHAETLEAAVRFEHYEPYLLVIVRDQGIGFNSVEVMSDPTIAHGLLGCSMEVNSRPGKGSEAIIKVPYDKLDNSL